MGRRSLAPERRRQIVAATIECMGTHGYADTTLERIADEANMARGHVRHYAGNREDLLTVAARAFFFGDDAVDKDMDLDTVAVRTPVISGGSTLTEALDYLFGAFAESTNENAAARAFIAAGKRIEPIRQVVLAAYMGMRTSLVDILSKQFPHADGDRLRQTAYGILTIALGATMLNDIEVSEQRVADARRAAEALVADLAAHSGTAAD